VFVLHEPTTEWPHWAAWFGTKVIIVNTSLKILWIAIALAGLLAL
jgi:hypothetical protein